MCQSGGRAGDVVASFEETVMVLDGPPANELETSVKLEDGRLVKVRWI